MGRVFAPHASGRIGQPEAIASAAPFLAADASSSVTSTPMIADGGLLARL